MKKIFEKCFFCVFSNGLSFFVFLNAFYERSSFFVGENINSEHSYKIIKQPQ